MRAHKFKLGAFVRLDGAKSLGAPRGRYQVVRLMPPAQDNHNQYHVKSVESGVERMVKEEDLS